MPRHVLAACCLALLAAGCGPSNGSVTQEMSDEGALNQVGELCRLYQQARKKSLAKFADIGAEKSVAALGYEAVKSGKVVLLYGASLPDLSEDPGQGGGDDQVLAYFADVPQSGGKVLMLDRTIKTMTAEEFKSAKKAGKEAPAAPGAKKAH